MKLLLIASLVFVAAPAWGEALDDYVACMIGRSAVVLHEQTKKDAYEAQEIAYDLCPAPANTDDGVGDYINLMVEKMAAE